LHFRITSEIFRRSTFHPTGTATHFTPPHGALLRPYMAGLRRGDELLLNKVLLWRSGWSCQDCAVRKQFRCFRSGGLCMGDVKMTITKTLTAAAVLMLTTALAPSAFAHEEYEDHAGHWGLHRQLYDAHRRAHEEGFYSRGEHRSYHRALRDMHDDFHEYRPRTWHDHYYGWGRYGR
jgi:hypothetical protein